MLKSKYASTCVTTGFSVAPSTLILSVTHAKRAVSQLVFSSTECPLGVRYQIVVTTTLCPLGAECLADFSLWIADKASVYTVASATLRPAWSPGCDSVMLRDGSV